jgi:hypothetical protein
MSFRVPEQYRIRSHPKLGSDATYGNNGAFMFPGPAMRDLFAIASDGEGWEHVSVSIPGRPNKTPSWEEMAAVKDLFWGPEDEVAQFHPKRSEYVNHHEGCLHLWRPIGRTIETPDAGLVGPR